MAPDCHPYLQAIAASWKSLPLDMVDYKATCKLRSTEDIFGVLEENSVMLSTMKVRVRRAVDPAKHVCVGHVNHMHCGVRHDGAQLIDAC